MADFTFEIHRMTPGIPKYHVVQTQFEGWKIKRRLKSSDPRRSWNVEIRGRTNTERDAIISHWNTQKGTLIPFNWVVPTFFGGDTFYVVYVDMSYANPEGLGNIWNFDINFLEELT